MTVALTSIQLDTAYSFNDVTTGYTDQTFSGNTQGSTEGINSTTYSQYNTTTAAGFVTGASYNRSTIAGSTGITGYGTTHQTGLSISGTTTNTTSTVVTTTGTNTYFTHASAGCITTSSTLVVAVSVSSTRTALGFYYTTDSYIYDDESGHTSTITYAVRSVPSTWTSTYGKTTASTVTESTSSVTTGGSIPAIVFGFGTNTYYAIYGNAYTLYNTIVRFLGVDFSGNPPSLNPEVLWLVTATDSTISGALSDIADSYTTDFTLMATDYLTSFTGAYVSSSTNFVGSFTTSVDSSTWTFLYFAFGTDSSSINANTYEQYNLGNVTLPTTFNVWFSSPVSTVTFNSFSTSIVGPFGFQIRSAATFTSTISGNSTMSVKVGTSFTENAQANDSEFPFGGDDFVPVNQKGLRSTTIVTSVTTTYAITSASEAIPNSNFTEIHSDYGYVGWDRKWTHWRYNIPQIAHMAGGAGLTFWAPTAGTGFGAIGTAGRPGVIYGAMHGTWAGPLSPYLLRLPWINPFGGASLAQRNSVSVPWLGTGTFTAQPFSTAVQTGVDDDGTFTYVGEDFLFGTCQFSSVNSTQGLISVTATWFDSGASTTGSVTDVMSVGMFSASGSNNISGQINGGPHAPFFGGRQSGEGVLTYGGESATIPWLRNITFVSSDGASTITSTQVSGSRGSSTIATDVVAYESAQNSYSMSRIITSSGTEMLFPYFAPGIMWTTTHLYAQELDYATRDNLNKPFPSFP